jgi:hypothetical protein
MQNIVRLASAVSIMLVTLTLAACGEDPVRDPLTDGVMATFVADADTFRVWITNSQARSDVVAVWRGEGNRSVPDGRVNQGPGLLSYNEPWSWHLDQDDIRMQESASESCAGTPQEVEEDVASWITEKGRLCPPGARLIFLESL